MFEEVFRELGKGLDEAFKTITEMIWSLPDDLLLKLLREQGYSQEDAEKFISLYKKETKK